MINRTKIVLSIILSVILVVLFFLDFDLTNIFIYQIAEQIVKYSAVVCVILAVLAILGFAYRNKKTYFNSYKKIVCIAGYICALSTCITIEHHPMLSLHIIVLCVCDILLIVLLFNNFSKNKEDKNTVQNPFDPIKESSELFNSRQNQVDVFINLVEIDASNYGYSICINGEWGTGKTSFINAAIDKMKKKRIAYEEIRINSMELDNFESLANYFFSCVKNILKKNDVYVGIESEYKELVSSLVGTVVHEAAGGFFCSLFTSNSDYRANLQKLSTLLEEYLKNIKILVIVDDLERCGLNENNNGVNYLFFIKEIATLNRCICVFLLNYDEFLKTYNINAAFLDKFFNRRMNLRLPSESEIFANVISEYPYVEELYKLYKKNFEEHINEFRKRDSMKDYCDNVTEQYETFIHTFTNPRKAALFVEKLHELDITINQQRTDGSKNNYQAFLNKVNYRNQIFLLSFLYVAFPKEYESIETNGFMAYIDEFLLLNNTDGDNRNWLVNHEWCHRDTTRENNFIQSEIHRFIKYLIHSPKELPNIANGFTTLQEKHFATLLRNQKPENVLFGNLLDELLSTNIDVTDSENMKKYTTCFDNAFSLYKEDLTFDEVMQYLQSRTLLTHIIRKNNYFDIIYDHVLKLNIVDTQKSLNLFLEFAKIYMQHKTLDITMYLVLCANKIDDFITTLGECVLLEESCEKMVVKYCKEVVKKLDIHISMTSISLESLDTLINLADEACNKYNLSSSRDVKDLEKNAKEAVACIKNLYKIENSITSSTQCHPKKNTVGNVSYSELIQIIESKLNNYTDNPSEINEIANLINNLIATIYSNEESVTEHNMEQISRAIEEFHGKTKSSTAFLRFYFLDIRKRQLEKLAKSLL